MNNSHFALTLFALCGFSLLKADTRSEARARAISVLFSDFPTVVYTETDLLSELENDNAPRRNITSIPLTLRLPFVQLIGGLRALGQNTLTDIDRHYSAFLVGARAFTPPEGFGMVSSRDCYIGMLKGDIQPTLASDFGNANLVVIGGTHVWTWSAPPYEGYPKPTEFYAAQISPSYILITNNREDFQKEANALTSTVALSLRAPSASEAPGFSVTSKHQYWAYRSIRRSGPLEFDATGLAGLTTTAVALIFFADMNKSAAYFQVYTSDGITRTAPEGLPVSDLLHFQPAPFGCWQASMPLSGDTLATTTLFRLFSFFGFGVVL